MHARMPNVMRTGELRVSLKIPRRRKTAIAGKRKDAPFSRTVNSKPCFAMSVMSERSMNTVMIEARTDEKSVSGEHFGIEPRENLFFEAKAITAERIADKIIPAEAAVNHTDPRFIYPTSPSKSRIKASERQRAIKTAHKMTNGMIFFITAVNLVDASLF